MEKLIFCNTVFFPISGRFLFIRQIKFTKKFLRSTFFINFSRNLYSWNFLTRQNNKQLEICENKYFVPNYLISN